MFKAITKTQAHIILLLAILISTFFVVTPSPIVADTDNNITVNPDIITLDNLTAGSFNGLILLVANNEPVNIYAAGLGETPEGAVVALAAAQDTSIYSARTWISLDRTQLQPGTNQPVTIMINVPPGTSPGQRYASIVVENPSSAFSILIPVILTIDKASFTPDYSGQITSVTVPLVYQSKPVHIVTSFSNNGNCLITGAQVHTVIKDSDNNEVWNNTSLIPMPSVMPGYPRNIDVMYRTGLPAGSYTVTSTINLATGQAYNMSSSFIVQEPIPPPATPTLVSPGGVTAPGGDPITTLTPTFRWNAVTGADYYELVIRQSPFTDADIVDDEQEIRDATSFALPSGIIWGATEYRWELTAVNAYGSSEPAIFYFQTYGTPIRAITLTATNVAGSTATLNGALLSLGTDSSVAVSFEYGTTTGYGSSTTSNTMTTTGQVSKNITGLTPDTTYHYRIHVHGSIEAWGSDQLFHTPSAVPTITNISPAAEKAGATLTITGTNFITNTTVTFNGQNSPIINILSTTELTATVPNMGTANIASVTITVTNSGGSASSTSFSYIGSALVPTISGISPSSGVAGATITITGTHFINGTLVYFNGVQSISTSILSETQLTAQVPDLGMGNITNIPVLVTNSGGSVTSTNFNYTGNGSAATTTTTPPTNTAPPASTTPWTITPPTKPASSRISQNQQLGNYLLPEMDPDSLVVFSFNKDASYAESVNENWMEVYLSGFSGSGYLALAKYPSEPSGMVPFSAPVPEGGTGKTPIKFMDVFVDGVKTGTATVMAHYTADEIKGFNSGSLFLAYYYNGKWNWCENLSLSPSTGTVSGDIPIIRLNDTVVGLGGDKSSQSNASAPIVQNNNNDNGTGQGVPWSMVAIISAPIIIVGGVIVVVLARGRRKGTTDN